ATSLWTDGETPRGIETLAAATAWETATATAKGWLGARGTPSGTAFSELSVTAAAAGRWCAACWTDPVTQ
ncbi:unnamed protein product, partial [Prorocentrum cordatum]